MTKITTAGFIVTDNDLIYGFGATADDAWTDAMATFRMAGIAVLSDDDDTEQHGSWTRENDLVIRSASAGLLADIEARGGAIGWHHRDGVACTREEMEGE